MFIIRFREIVLEGFEDVEGVMMPVWTPTAEDAKRFATSEEAEAVMRQFSDGEAMLGAEVVPVES